jgi:hypothetical protein
MPGTWKAPKASRKLYQTFGSSLAMLKVPRDTAEKNGTSYQSKKNLTFQNQRKENEK